MKHIIRFAALGSAVLLSVVSNPVPVIAVGETQSKHIIIAELSPESPQSASQEYVVLYNSDTVPADVTGWQLQYRSASHTQADAGGWTVKAILGCQTAKTSDCTQPAQTVIDAGESLRLSSFETAAGVAPLVSGMATIGGEVRLLTPRTETSAEVTQDLVGYGNAESYEGSGAAVPAQPGQSMVRSQDQAATYIDTDDNAHDFMLSQPENTLPTNDSPLPGQSTPSTAYLDATITEVMPDPASPQLDTADEFVELYNPYDQAIDLTDYVLKAGSTWSYKYVIRDTTIESHEYLVFMASQTHLPLSNAGSGVRLYDPNGKLLFEVPSYGKAQTGQSWVQSAGGQWVWTAQPTPGEQNIIVMPSASEPAEATVPQSATSTPKKTPAKATTSTSTKKASVPKASTGSVKGASTTQPAQLSSQPKNNMNLFVLLVLGIGAGAYVLYEYRHELIGMARRLRAVIARRGGP